MSKVLIVGLEFREYPQEYAKAFEKQGFEVQILNIDLFKCRNAIESFMMSLKIVSRDKCKKRNIEKFNFDVINTCRSFCPDIVFTINNAFLTADTLKEIKKKSKLIMSMYDSISRWSEIKYICNFYDVILTYLQDDVPIIKQFNKNVEYYPACYANDKYYFLNTRRDIDLCFVGSNQDDRYELISRLISDFPNLKIKVYGIYFTYRPLSYIKHVFDRRGIWQNVEIKPSEVNVIYNRSKIVLNILSKQNIGGWSSRLPEIAATKTLQISSWDKTIESNFGQYIPCFKDYDELKNLVAYYIAHYDEGKALAEESFKYTAELTIDNYIKDALLYLKKYQ